MCPGDAKGERATWRTCGLPRVAERSVGARRVTDRCRQDSQRGGPFLYTKRPPESGGPGQLDMGCNVGTLGRARDETATARRGGEWVGLGADLALAWQRD